MAARAQLSLGPAWVQAVKPGLTCGRTTAWRLRREAAPPGLRILFYHRVADARDPLAISPRRFRAQMAWLQATGYRVVDLAAASALLAGGNTGDGVVGLCFDDGYRDVAENALGVLEHHGFRATVFVVPGVADGTARFTWYARQPPVLGWEEITRLDRGSPFSFEAHTLTHPNLMALGEGEAEREIGGSKLALESRLGRPVTGFCYPAGVYGARERALVAAAGFRAATTCEPGANLPGGDPLTLRRIAVDAHDRLADFRAKVEGGFDRPSRLRDAYRRARLVPRVRASVAR
jgi:peptidoglycan/xylan/chitin deacetylase (PgdA/CDA1 family)